MVPCKSTANKVSFKWSHHRILSTDSEVRTALHVSKIVSGSETVDALSSGVLKYVESGFELTHAS